MTILQTTEELKDLLTFSKTLGVKTITLHMENINITAEFFSDGSIKQELKKMFPMDDVKLYPENIDDLDDFSRKILGG